MQTIDLVRVAVALVAGFLLGGIPFGIIVTRLIGGPDPRNIGSGRTGGANVSRAVGYRWAAVSGLLAIRFMLAFLRRQPVTLFVVYRVLLAAAVFIVLLSPHGA